MYKKGNLVFETKHSFVGNEYYIEYKVHFSSDYLAFSVLYCRIAMANINRIFIYRIFSINLGNFNSYFDLILDQDFYRNLLTEGLPMHQIIQSINNAMKKLKLESIEIENVQ